MSKIKTIFFIIIFLLPNFSFAQNIDDAPLEELNQTGAAIDLEQNLSADNEEQINSGQIDENKPAEELFKAKVIEIIEQKEIIRQDKSKNVQQKLKLLGLSGAFKGKEIIFNGISEIDDLSANVYKKGDKLLVGHVINSEGQDEFYISDFIRRDYIYILMILFALVVLVVGKMKGLRSILSLVVSFFIIVEFIIPQILNGRSPLLIGILGSFAILTIIIYLTEGWNKKSHIATVCVFITLTITALLSYAFTYLSKLTGLASEEATFLIGMTNHPINFTGLLLAGILIGTVGVLDDIIIGQIEAVRQLKETDPNLSKKQTFKSAYEIGNSHFGAIINTLFLTYSGASLPLLMLFYLNKSSSNLTLSGIINHEQIATEIIRTIVGSIGLALALPIATYIACYYYCKNNI